MNDSKEMRELEKLSAGLAPKKGSCKMCKVIFIASIVLLVSTIALVALESRMSGIEAPTQRKSSPAELSSHIQDLRAYAKSKQGTTTSIIVRNLIK